MEFLKYVILIYILMGCNNSKVENDQNFPVGATQNQSDEAANPFAIFRGSYKIISVPEIDDSMGTCYRNALYNLTEVEIGQGKDGKYFGKVRSKVDSLFPFSSADFVEFSYESTDHITGDKFSSKSTLSGDSHRAAYFHSMTSPRGVYTYRWQMFKDDRSDEYSLYHSQDRCSFRVRLIKQ